MLPALADAPCALASRAYRIDTLSLPATVTAALEISLDLDHDEAARPDNSAGAVYSLIASQYDGRLQQLGTSIEAALADGRVRWVLEVQTCQGGGAHARVGLHRASDLDGDGVLRLLPFGYLPAVGERDGTRITAVEGTTSAPVATLFDVLGIGGDPGWVDGYAFAISIDQELDGGALTGRLGLGLDERAFAIASVPMAAFFSELLALGESDYARSMDTDGDGAITPDELVADQYMASLGAPDLDLTARFEGVEVYWPRRDEIEDSISLGLGFTAVPVELE